MTEPLVSCIMPTCGRPPTYTHLIEEAIYWFTRQDYQNRELIICNDHPQQYLFSLVPKVTVINRSIRFPTLGQKYDYLVSQAQGEIILPWEDDDISLPHRISQAVERLKNADYFNPQKSWYYASGVLHSDHAHGVCHNASAYRKTAWEKVGGYGAYTGNQDAVIDWNLKRDVARLSMPLNNDKYEWSYIYRWGVSPLHLSGFENMQEVYNQEPVKNAKQLIVYLNAVMGQDFEVMTQSACYDGKCTGACVR